MMDIDGAWFVTLGSSNGIAGEDLRVLVGQFTTDGVISGFLNLQVFSQGMASQDFMDDVYTIQIPEFDGGALPLNGPKKEVLSWITRVTEEGYRHHTGGACRWMVFDVSGQLMDEGLTPNGRFQTPGGIVAVRGVGSHVNSRRWFPPIH